MLRFQRYTPEDGIADIAPFVYNIIQDRSGFLWIPSMDGLNRFDGREFKLFDYQGGSPQGPSNNTIFGLCEDSFGNIWIGLRTGWLNIYDPVTETFEEVGPNLPPDQQICVGTVKRIMRDREGNMWVSSDHGVCKCEKGTQEFKLYDLGGRRAASILQKADGSIWAGTQLGIFRLDESLDRFVFYEPVPERSGEIPINKAEMMMEGPEGEIWFSSRRQGQHLFDPKTETFHPLPLAVTENQSGVATEMHRDRTNNIWIGNSNSLIRYDENHKTSRIYHHDITDPNSIQNGAISALLLDRAGSLWVGSYLRTGLSVIHTLDNPFEQMPEANYQAMIPWNERQLLFSTTTGFVLFDIYEGRLLPGELPPILRSARGDCLALSSTGVLWWRDRQQRKIFGYNRHTATLEELSIPNRFAIDSKDRLWFRSKRLKYYDSRSKRLVEKEDIIQRADTSGRYKSYGWLSMAFDSQDRLWIAADRAGLIMLDTNTDSVRFFRHDPQRINSPPVGKIAVVSTGRDDRVYFRTTTGFSIYHPTRDTFLNFDISQGVQRPVIEGDDHHLWIAGRDGLTKLDPTSGRREVFDETDGLPAGFFRNHIAGKDALGYLYVEKGGKLLRFHPDSVRQKSYIAPIVFTDFYLNRKKVTIGAPAGILTQSIDHQRNIRLRHNQSDFGFRYVSPTFYKAERIQYEYQLVNYDQEWIPVGNQLEVHFTNVPAGDYQFRVRARSVGGQWTHEPATLHIQVLPAWWESWWAYAFYLVCGGLIFYGLYRYQLRRRLVEMEASSLKELDTLKTKFYTNVTHEFRTPLTVIQGMAEQLPKGSEAKSLIRRNSARLLQLVNQLLDLAKFDAGGMKLKPVKRDIVSYLSYLSDSFHSYATSRGIHLEFSTNRPELIMRFDPDRIQDIMANLLSNAIKFSERHGTVSVSVFASTSQAENSPPAWIEVSVKDTGIGIDEVHLPHIFDRFYQVDTPHIRHGEGTGIGLALAKELVELMGGTLTVKSKRKEATEFTMRLPVGVEDEATWPLSTETELKGNMDGKVAYAEAASITVLPVSNGSKEGSGDELPLVLIIEDNRDVVSYIQICLREEYRLCAAYDGQSGIDTALEVIPDLIISDVMMPARDGYEVTDYLKQDERTSHIPIVLLTAKVDAASRLEGLRRGADAYLAKPFDRKELMIRLEKLLELRRQLRLRYSQGVLPAPTPDIDLRIEDAFLGKVREAVIAQLDNTRFGVSELCLTLGISQPQLYRKIKALTGKSIAAHIRSIRLLRGYELLQSTDLNISEVAYAVGFTDPNYFSKSFVKEFGFLPSKIGR